MDSGGQIHKVYYAGFMVYRIWRTTY